MEIFHVLNRGVDKRNIFANDKDRLRFMQGLYLYNDKQILDNNARRKSDSSILKNKREILVYIHAFCLMDNHYHLLLSPVKDDLNNLSAFMRKLNMGYSKYFNGKYERKGALWQGKYKSIHIGRDAYFQYIPYYIHLNPLDIKFPKWRTGEVMQVNKAISFLHKYKWSSFLDYNGIKNYPSIITTDVLADILDTKKQQEKTIKDIIQNSELSAHSYQLE